MPEGLPDINLLPKYERQSSKSFILYTSLIVMIVLLLLFFGTYYFITKSKLHSVETTYQQLSSEAEVLHEQLKNIETDHSSSLKEAVHFARNHTIPTSTFILEINDLLPKHSYLGEYEYGNQVAEVTGHFETLDSVAEYTTELASSSYINDTKVNIIETFTLKDEESEETD